MLGCPLEILIFAPWFIKYIATYLWLLLLQPTFPLHTYSGHTSHVVSLDFHPKKTELFCSCDNNNEIRFWSISQYSSTRVFKVTYKIYFIYQDIMKLGLFSILNRIKLIKQGGSTQVRFQPRLGHLLAAASGSVVSLFDVETDRQMHTLQV